MQRASVLELGSVVGVIRQTHVFAAKSLCIGAVYCAVPFHVFVFSGKKLLHAIYRILLNSCTHTSSEMNGFWKRERGRDPETDILLARISDCRGNTFKYTASQCR